MPVSVGCSVMSVSHDGGHLAAAHQGGGLAALGDAPRSGAPPTITRDKREEILAATLTPPPEMLRVLVEVFFAIITRQAIRRASFRSVREVTDAIRRFIDAWNERCTPFVWTKTPDQIPPRPTVKPRQLQTTRSSPAGRL